VWAPRGRCITWRTRRVNVSKRPILGLAMYKQRPRPNPGAPSRHSPSCSIRWVTAIRRLATATPVLVNLVRGPSGLRFLVPLAGLEPATCCLGDGSAWALCRSANFLSLRP
jgi:hypothetical protein